jgi:hypothetical protein
MEEYPARLALIDHGTGKIWPPDKPPALMQIDLDSPLGQLSDYRVEVLDYISKAMPVGEGRFAMAITQASEQAAFVRATDLRTSETFEGWLTSGNSFLPPNSLRLATDQAAGHGPVLAMTRPEPQLFLSKIKVFTKEGLEMDSTVAVNHPLRVGEWLIYQRDYDTEAGPASGWSGFELIKDPWLPLAYIGFIIWSIGCLGLIIRGRRKVKSGNKSISGINSDLLSDPTSATISQTISETMPGSLPGPISGQQS